MTGTNKTNTALLFSAALALLSLPIVSTTARAQTVPVTPAPAAKEANRVMGVVTAVDTTANTITVQTRDGASVVATTFPKTKVSTLTPEALTDLKSGDIIAVGARRGDVAGGTTVTATRILVLDELPKKEGTGKRGVVGTIVTTTPGLTITTDDGTTVAITTEPTTRVWGSTPSTIASVAVGDRVEIRGKAEGTGLRARAVTIMPARKA